MNEKYTAKHSAGYSRKSILMLALLAAAALVLVILAIVVFTSDAPEEPEALPEVTEEAAAAAPEVSGTLERPEEPALPEEPVITYSNFEPHAAQSTEPSAHITETAVQVGEETVENYSASDVITFGLPGDYAKIDGLLTFRGDNFRSGSSVGFAEDMETKTFGESWSSPVSTLVAPDGNVWTGCGWTGQPLIVNWPKETRAIMNMYDWAKEAEELVEVIYPTMDGHIYFMELETGEPTRETLDMGYTFKGAGSIDPRGYPVLYVGAGYRSMNGEGRVFAISLIDFEILFTFGNADEFELRDWPCFDAAPLVDAETDQLIYAGENGILYIVKLNSSYDETA
ncbi:MAG: pyrrolo-quinoline quinone, partial [Oscillospiraceae bacterium]|nr:pyrrolo-quinoline quinone [Oscillospiraceae bacterium]